MRSNNESVITKNDKICCFQTKKKQAENKFHIEITHLIDELFDIRQQTVAWMIYHSMKNSYPLDVVGFSIELWCNYCDEIDPMIDDDGKYAASIELFVSKLLSRTPHSKTEILYKYGLHKKYDPISLKL